MRKFPKLIDLTGKKFGRLKVLERTENLGREARWICICDCGNASIVLGRNLRSGGTKSCGCYNREEPMTHGMSRTRFYRIWKSISNRCNGFTENTRRLYKNKGITMCSRWEEFGNFYQDMYESYTEHVKTHGESRTTLDRIDGSSGYRPDNCRWATYEVQSRNRKFANEYPGVVKRKDKWRVNIGANGIQIHIGTFDSFEEAVEARKKAEEKYWEDCLYD